ncbi:hypothetical protein F2Q68_00026529 [Brassica cretica]|uniref:DNA-directed RNA polymerase RBP11-like dimerisation domain-containing protein n=1 Tax=Brassica cretica TaxID=69181 RepID=A0A8S9IGI7_BRACR|nr:hypothetical protein F2Q68_00026529 [Brassica cretica]
MEAAQIDWKRIDSRFVEDVFYEHLRAPKWFDFLSPNNHLQDSIDDAWFCKPDCNHPKRPEDFLLLTPNSSKQTPGVTEQNQRIRGHALSEDSENQNPNLATPPPSQQGNQSWRAALKSTSVKKMNKETPKKLKSTQSARNLDILGHISEFCYELKRLATRGVTEREETTVKPQVKEAHDHQVHDLELKKERKPLLEVSKDKDKVHESTDAKGSTIKESPRQLHRDENVLFAGYQLPHPLKYKIIVRIHTTSQSSPMQAYNQAINDLDKELDFLKSQFELVENQMLLTLRLCASVLSGRGGQVLDSLLRSSEFSIGTLESHFPYSKHQPEDL